MNLRTPDQIEKIHAACRAVAAALDAIGSVGTVLEPGLTTAELNCRAESTLRAYGADTLFAGQTLEGTDGPFPSATCVSVNEEVIHGVPGDRVLREGDIVTVDCGAVIDGWCGDSARSYAVGRVDGRTDKLMRTTLAALNRAIEQIGPGQKWSEIARGIQNYAEKAGFGVVRDFLGHGVGKTLHEPPHVPNYVDAIRKKKKGPPDFVLTPGLVIAIEPMFTMGTFSVQQASKGAWPIVTQDGKASAHFEHTIAVTETGVRVLTA